MRASAAVARGVRLLGSDAEARTLLAHVLGVEPRALALAEVSDADLAAFDVLAARRLAGEPLQHITGRAAFRTIDVAVGPGVFVPRPETELLAGWALGVLDGLDGRPRVVELCAGSGAIAKALAAEHPHADYWAVELSDAAWPYLLANLDGTGVHAVRADMAGALPELNGTVDVVVANPPYVPSADAAALPADVLADPASALFGGPDGLDAVRVVAEVAARLLRPGGCVGCEHDDSHEASAPAVFAARGFAHVRDHRDLAGRPRYVTGQAIASEAGRMGA